MLLLEAGNIKKAYGDRLIIEFLKLKIYTGDRIGIVGQNGSGKTTLMNILSGEIAPDEGFVKRYCSIAYIRQFSDEGIEAGQQLLSEFNLSRKSHHEAFSGGEQTRIKIANAFSSEGVLVLADEPTSNLDYRGIELLRQKLSRLESFLLISHDRSLLDGLCNRIIEVKDGKLQTYAGNYSSYKEQNELAFQRALQEHAQYIDDKTHLEEAIRDRQGKSRSIKKAPKRMGNSEARLHKRQANEKQEKVNDAANSLKTRLEKLKVKEKPKELPRIKLDFSLTHPPENKIVIAAKGLSFGYDSNQIFDGAGFSVPNGSKTAVWGENGTGKSTLLNLIYGRSCESIHIAPKARIGYFHQNFENLDEGKTILENVMQDSIQSQAIVRTILARLLFHGDTVYKKVACLSGGEKIKVSFAKLFVGDANILLMDEPTNYLDMLSIDALEDVLKDYEGTILVVSHDSAFVNVIADRLLILENRSIREFEGTLEEYQSKHSPAGGREGLRDARDGIEQMAVKMRMAQLAARLADPRADKSALEAEYQQLQNIMHQK